MNRSHRANLARETLAIVESGSYLAPSGQTVDLHPAIQSMLGATVTYSPGELAALAGEVPGETESAMSIEVTGETTLAAARRLGDLDGSVLALNFASAKNPGGGFLNGSQAQEESLARSSALYASQLRGRTMYDANRGCGTCLYTDHMIYSPRVPVFREDAGALLESPFFVSILTAPAANAGALREGERPRLTATMLQRTKLVLAVASKHGHRSLVLGAWGCGVFRNEASQVAAWFASHLLGSGAFAKAFARVVFAVHDSSAGRANYESFRRAFAPAGA